MIGRLPTTLNVNGKDYEIRTDYRDILLIFEALNDDEIPEQFKTLALVSLMYVDFDNMADDDMADAVEKAKWFINCGDTVSKPASKKPLYDWQQDEQIIFSAINKVAGKEIRAMDYLHWWSFMGLFNEIGEGVFNTVVSIRMKKNKGKKLEKHEQEFYRTNKQLVDIKRKSIQDLADLEALDEILKGD